MEFGSRTARGHRSAPVAKAERPSALRSPNTVGKRITDVSKSTFTMPQVVVSTVKAGKGVAAAKGAAQVAAQQAWKAGMKTPIAKSANSVSSLNAVNKMPATDPAAQMTAGQPGQWTGALKGTPTAPKPPVTIKQPNSPATKPPPTTMSKAFIPTSTRRKDAAKGKANKDGSFPVTNPHQARSALILARSGHGSPKDRASAIRRADAELSKADARMWEAKGNEFHRARSHTGAGVTGYEMPSGKPRAYLVGSSRFHLPKDSVEKADVDHAKDDYFSDRKILSPRQQKDLEASRQRRLGYETGAAGAGGAVLAGHGARDIHRSTTGYRNMKITPERYPATATEKATQIADAKAAQKPKPTKFTGSRGAIPGSAFGQTHIAKPLHDLKRGHMVIPAKGGLKLAGGLGLLGLSAFGHHYGSSRQNRAHS